jgi:hypothetical protein
MTRRNTKKLSYSVVKVDVGKIMELVEDTLTTSPQSLLEDLELFATWHGTDIYEYFRSVFTTLSDTHPHGIPTADFRLHIETIRDTLPEDSILSDIILRRILAHYIVKYPPLMATV